ncbi:effector binding domain-containing protein [Cohnella abietis]|uniref:Transcription activator, effector binding domain-containing protein n=1 Tax=Cohnella abietis TaxID=2507935 RepID=A0A3T1D4I2_9BACL|nr:effector binding domain-containing protein [Cohnella abietis]BBI33020.1 transcription activator, effector binding domain-containing protein [Cohnella abietis]
MQQVELHCQSCGMPLPSQDVYGTDQQGNVITQYCKYCYENGQFTQPDFTVDDMVSFCVPFLVEEGMDEQVARGMLASSLPSLERWRSGEEQQSELSFEMTNLDEIKLVGVAARTTNKDEMGEQAKIGALWGKFWGEGIQQSIPHIPQTGAQPVYGCYIDYENGAAGEYTILIGSKVNEIDAIPEGLTAKVIPASRYAVFTTKKGQLPGVVVDAWQDIWRLSAESKLQRTFTGDFELYGESCADPANAQVDIYIAIE